jgi:hypothetical protein
METALGTLRKTWQHVSARWIADEVRQRICVRTQDQNNQISLATYGCGGDVTSRGASDVSARLPATPNMTGVFTPPQTNADRPVAYN